MVKCFECENRTPNGECYIGTIERCPKLRDYLFIDNESGEQFFVECESLAEAWEIARDNWGEETDDLEYLGEYEPWEAEILGYDTF